MTQTASLSQNPISFSSLHKMDLFFQKMAPSCWWRMTHETEQMARNQEARSRTLPTLSMINTKKDNTPVLQFNKYLKSDTKTMTFSNTQPTHTCIMLDLDQDSAVWAFGCLTHAELRDHLTARLLKQDVPFLTFASASGKTKIAIAVKLANSKYIKRMEHKFVQEVVTEMLYKLGLKELATTDYDSCHAGFWAFALTRQVGLEMTQEQFQHSMKQEPFDLTPVIYKIRQESAKKLKVKFDLNKLEDEDIQATLATLTERETAVLEYALASATVDNMEDNVGIEVSQRCLAATLECSVTTIARALKVLVAKGLLKKLTVGNTFTTCAKYTISQDMMEALITSEEKAESVRVKIQQVRQWNGLSGVLAKAEGSEDAILTWLNTNKPLIDGKRFSHYPAWYGCLTKIGYSVDQVISCIMIHNKGLPLTNSEVRTSICWLARRDQQKAG
jgi:Fe2+ or Zn2+ uptake regulation protein